MGDDLRLVELSNLKWFVPCCTDPDCSDHTHNRRRHNLSACLNNDDQSADVETHNCSYFDLRIMSHTQCCINIPVLFFEKCSLLQDASQEATNAPSGLLRRRQRCVELVHHDLLGQQPHERVPSRLRNDPEYQLANQNFLVPDLAELKFYWRAAACAGSSFCAKNKM